MTPANRPPVMAEDTAGDPQPAHRIDLARLARLAWADRVRLARLYAAVAAAAVVAVLLLPRWYTGSATLVPAPNDGLTLDFSGVGAALGGASLTLSGAPTPQDQLKMVLTSRAVADSMVRRFDLVRTWRLKRRDQARERLAERTTLTTPKEGQVVVAVEARSPREARDLAAAYVEFAGHETVRLKTSLAAQRRAYLEARLAEIERDVARAAAGVRAFEEKNGAVALGEQTRQTMDAAATLQAQVALLETELAAARRYYTDASPQVSLLRDRIGELRRQLDRLARQGGTLLIRGVELPALKEEYVRLTRELTSLTAVAELLRRAYEQSRVEEANPVPTFSVLDAAELPERHSRPRRALTVVVVLALAAAGSLVHLLWRDRHSFETVAERPRADGPGAEEREAA
jgi:uncharacterized protein involved in exopolysaccharide biosynthesis